MTFASHFFREPLLEFANVRRWSIRRMACISTGREGAGAPRTIHVGVVGTREGIALAGSWLSSLQGALQVERPEQLHTSPFPGFQAAFGIRLEPVPLVAIELPRNEIVAALEERTAMSGPFDGQDVRNGDPRSSQG